MNTRATITPRWYDSAAQKMLSLDVPMGETVNFYACGITPYAAPHIGHARSFVVFDAFAKSLRSLGWPVNFVRNITDIDDKIIQAAKSQNTTWQALSSHWADVNRALFEKLGVSPTPEPKVSEAMPDILALIQSLIEKGHAYSTGEGNVYFSVSSNHPTNVAHQPQGALRTATGLGRVQQEDKINPEDFALWKNAKEGEPFFESPWGRGRPGWHIECSAMIESHFKGPIHIHGGGIDLRFPHHQCEAHQSEAHLGKPLANHWVHHGSVLSNGQKMSKSLGNVVSVESAIQEAEALLPGRGAVVVRFALLSAHWQKPLDWTPQVLKRAAGQVERLEKSIQKTLLALSETELEENPSISSLEKSNQDLMEALADNFNTPLVLNLIQKLAKESKSISLVWQALEAIGFDAKFWPAAWTKVSSKTDLIPNEVESLFEQRQKARQGKDFKASDELRHQMDDLGWVVQDSNDGSVLKRKSPK